MNARIVAGAALVLLMGAALLPGNTPAQTATRPWGNAQGQQFTPPTDPAVQPQQNSADALKTRAQICMATKQYDEAIQNYKALLKLEPANAQYMNMLGIAYLQEVNLGEAKRYFERATKADKTFASAYNNIGTVWYQKKKFRRAVREYQKAIEVEPTVASFHANLGYAYFNDKKYPDALSAFHDALALDSHVLDRTDRLGMAVTDRTVSNHGDFFFLIAKEFAAVPDAARCAEYLRKAFEDGNKNVSKIKTDPAFAKVIADPQVMEVLQLATAGNKEASKRPEN